MVLIQKRKKEIQCYPFDRIIAKTAMGRNVTKILSMLYFMLGVRDSTAEISNFQSNTTDYKSEKDISISIYIS